MAASSLDNSLDWKKCCLCQKDGPELIRCPLDSVRSDGVKNYSEFLQRAVRFVNTGQSPLQLKFDPGTTDLSTHRAKWHPSCLRKFSNDKLSRVEKPAVTRGRPLVSPTREQRPKPRSRSVAYEECLFCANGEGIMHNFSTMEGKTNM
jgi:hypothetical protein